MLTSTPLIFLPVIECFLLLRRFVLKHLRHILREGEPRDVDYWTVAEVLAELLSIESGRHEDQLKVRFGLEQVGHDSHLEVRLNVPLIHLIHDQERWKGG